MWVRAKCLSEFVGSWSFGGRTAAISLMILLGCNPAPERSSSVATTVESQPEVDLSPEVSQQATADDVTDNSSSKQEISVPTPDTESPPSNSFQATGDSDTSEISQEDAQQLYSQHCASCHGKNGDGQGLAAPYLFPKPRNFRAGRFRLVSTGNNVPTREDLHKVLLRGMPGSSMPPWSHLSRAERDALVDEIMRLRYEGAKEEYVNMLKDFDGLTDEEIAEEEVQEEIQEFSERFITPGETTEVPDIPPATEASIARGKEIYTASACHQCHGTEGKGDGVQKMVDEEGYPTSPRDFTEGIFKGDHEPSSLYRRIAFGMPGTPMPGSKQLTTEQMIDLVHFIRSFSTEEERQRAILNRETIVVTRVSRLPESAESSAWQAATPISPRMMPLWWRDDADPEMQVAALHDGESIAFRITWQDESADWRSLKTESFEDAVALELSRGNEPFIGMGDSNAPLDIWFWDADRQTASDVEDEYSRVIVDNYPFSEANVESPEFQRESSQNDNQPPISLPARAVGNQIIPQGSKSGGSNLAAIGPQSSTFRLPKNQLVTANGRWADGRWSVMMSRRLQMESPDQGISLKPGDNASLALAVWNGSVRDRDGKKIITIWQDLKLTD